MKSAWKILGLFVPLMLLAGCGMIGVNVNNGVATVTVRLDEAMVNTIISQVVTAANANAKSQGQDFMGQIDSITFTEPDKLHVSGLTKNSSGSVVPGTLDLQVSTVNGALKMQVIAVNVPGMDMNSPTIKQVNDALTQAFNAQAMGGKEATVRSARVVGKTLEIVLDIKVQ